MSSPSYLAFNKYSHCGIYVSGYMCNSLVHYYMAWAKKYGVINLTFITCVHARPGKTSFIENTQMV